jgi:biopolymer transport protein ExbD
MAVQINKGTALGALSLTPLIDVVFLLLIFFLVTTRFAQEDRELDVVLPSASEAQPLTAEPKELFININREGAYYVDGQTLTVDEVADVLRQAVTNNPISQSVVIRADKRVQFDFVVAIMNLCNQAGVRDYTVTTQGDASSGP